MLALGALLLSVAPAPAKGQFAGFYRSQQMEVGAALELKKNGHFRYQLDYGAVSESASGDWTFDGKAVHLTTRPMPKAPSFELVHDDAAPKGELYMTVDSPGMDWGHPLEAVATADMKKGFEVSADDTGRVDLTGKPPVAAIAPLMPVYGATGQIFQLDRERGHRLQFRFHGNDLGKAAFKGEPLTSDGPNLVLLRYGTRIRFIRVRP
jgi:hypothetical protein